MEYVEYVEYFAMDAGYCGRCGVASSDTCSGTIADAMAVNSRDGLWSSNDEVWALVYTPAPVIQQGEGARTRWVASGPGEQHAAAVPVATMRRALTLAEAHDAELAAELRASLVAS